MPVINFTSPARRALTGILSAGFAVIACCALAAAPASAQSVDSLTAALASTDVLARGSAVEALSQMPVTAIPFATRDALIALLEREATGAQPVDSVRANEADEAWGEYIIGLADLVRTLGDSRALRGLALLGIQTSRATQEFVAGFGAQALPQLDEAWTTKPDARPSVVTTWALIANTADSTTRIAVLHRLFAPDDTFPIALADAAVAGKLVVMVPFLDSLGQSDTVLPIAQGAASEAAEKLRPAFTALSADQLLAQYNAILDGICLNSTGALNGYCESSTNGLDNSTKHLLKDSGSHVHQGAADQARQEIQTVIDRTLNAVANEVLTPAQGILLVSGLRQVIARIS